MASRNITDLDPTLQPIAQEHLQQARDLPGGAHMFLTCTYRSNEEQNEDYAKGRTAPGNIITWAKAGESPHNCTLADGTPAAKAYDIAIENADGTLDWSGSSVAWQEAISIGQELGLESGTTFPPGKQDRPHFQLFNWRTS